MNTDREHLDAETIAAWIDGGLDARSLAAAEAHASNCDRCQALLATVAQTLPATESGSLNAADAPRRLWRWWLAPIAAATAAVTIWMVVPQEPMQRPATPAQSEVAPAQDRPTPPPAGTRLSESRPAPRRQDAEAKRRDVAEQSIQDSGQLNKSVADAAVRQEKQEAATVRDRAAVKPAAPPPPAPVAAPSAAIAAAEATAAPLEIISPAPDQRWRVRPGTIEYSQDGGRTWIPVRLTAGEAITAGASPSPRVCWFVGRQGLVLLATDGTNFTRLPFPERADLVSVTALDARRATVVTADGRTFDTADNGRNWRIR